MKNHSVIPAQAGIQHAGKRSLQLQGTTPPSWIPAFAGMTSGA
jgi:hypothetical protein